MKKLGVIGGMGPAASVLFYDMVTACTPAKKDQEHLPMVILSHADMPDRTASILGYPGAEPQEKVLELMTKDAEYLKMGGCEAMAVTCNTAHYFLDEVEKRSGLPVIHMIRLTAQAAASCDNASEAPVAILATEGTVKTGLYQNALTSFGANYYVPEASVQNTVTSLIYDKVKAGVLPTAEDWAPVDRAVKAAGCKCAILGCTELSVIRRALALDPYYLDAMEVLAKACVAWSLNG